MKILIAEDDPVSRRLLQATLQRWQYEVVLAADGEEAWNMLRAEDAPNIAILDWLMPELDGLEVCRRVRRRTDAPYIYLILLTSKDRKEDIMEGMEAGADDYLIKPFETHRLEVRLRAGRRIIDLQSELLDSQAALRTSLAALAQARHAEVEIGAKIQQTLLLGQPPRNMPGAQVAALTIPSQQIDGDFYDFFRHSDRCLDVIVGDVMGKGVPAALFGAAIKSHFLRALGHLMADADRNEIPEPEQIVTAVHSEVTGQFIGLNSFMTLCYARFDQENGRVVFVDCGHTKTIHVHARTGDIDTLQGDSMPLGISESETYAQVVAPFEPGDVFCFYSDGVTEARNPAGEFFGFDRLVEVIREGYSLSPDDLVARVREVVVSFAGRETFSDDLTCVVIKILATELPAPALVAKEETPLRHAEQTVTSALWELANIRAFVRGFCEELPAPGLDVDGVNQLELAVNEASSNIMRHAYGGRPDQPIQVEADAFGDHLEIRLVHTGKPFDPETAKPPVFDGTKEGGFGVYMITECVDEVRYSRDAHGRNLTALIKSYGAPPGQN